MYTTAIFHWFGLQTSVIFRMFSMSLDKQSDAVLGVVFVQMSFNGSLDFKS